MQFQWHDGTVKNIHVDPPFLYEYQVSEGSHQSEQGMREGAPRSTETEPLPELSLVNGLCSPPGISGGFFSPAPGRDLEASDRSP